MINRLAGVRKSRGIAAVDLAAQAGITRQAIYAIEAGTYVPNTSVALRLARALETSVEDLFALDDETAPANSAQTFEPLDETSPGAPGEPIQICRVGRRVIGVVPPSFPAYLPVADGVVSDSGLASLAAEPNCGDRLLVAGCDPALSLLASYAREAGIEVVLANANSARALEWLREGKVDIAGTHVGANPTGSSVVTFALWEEGFVVRRGNPKSIRTIADLANPLVKFVNRDPGSGSRKLFDSQIAAAGIPLARIRGSESCVSGHLAAAWAVASGAADCCIAAGSAARRFGLEFIPLASERFELVLHKRDMTKKAVEGLFDVLNRSRLRRQLETVAGYDVSHAGETVC
jgi:molybdate-binding protein/DNA-binding XRE family transcriptional regulator